MKYLQTLIAALFLSLMLASCEKEHDGYGPNDKDNNLNGDISVMPDDEVVHRFLITPFYPLPRGIFTSHTRVIYTYKVRA